MNRRRPASSSQRMMPTAKNVGARVDRAALGRLGREVAELALDDAGLATLELAVGLCEAEVHDLYFAEARDQHVRRRHVAVHDVQALALAVGELVRVGQAFADAHADQARFFDGKWQVVFATKLDDALEIGAIDVLHDDEVGVVADANVEHLHAVGVRQVRTDARLVQEHADELLLLGQVRKNALDGDDLLEALEPRALGSVKLLPFPRTRVSRRRDTGCCWSAISCFGLLFMYHAILRAWNCSRRRRTRSKRR